jgi:hypothetical protein
MILTTLYLAGAKNADTSIHSNDGGAEHSIQACEPPRLAFSTVVEGNPA